MGASQSDVGRSAVRRVLPTELIVVEYEERTKKMRVDSTGS